MNTKDDGGPAYPKIVTDWNQDIQDYTISSVGGASLRDYFAAKAMQALLKESVNIEGYATVHGISSDAYKVADAMIAERNKG